VTLTLVFAVFYGGGIYYDVISGFALPLLSCREVGI
jgi:hypothetical protein